MKIAVIILNYNSSDDCRKCISYLKRQEHIETEPVVVDLSLIHISEPTRLR